MTVRCSPPTETDRVWLRSTILSLTPRHELVEARDLVVRDAADGVGEPCLRIINAVQLDGPDQRIGDGSGFGRAF